MRGKPRDTAAVVITFHPRLSQLRNLRSLATQLDRVFVVDNTPGTGELPYFRHARGIGNVQVLRLGINCGIAAALNVGMRLAEAAGFAWVATLDQDSYFPLGAIRRLRRVPMGADTAIMAPAIRDAFTQKLLFSTSASERRERTVVITSGNLVRVSAWRAVQGFDPQLFLDMVDYDFCLRLRNQGWSIEQSGAALLLHQWGNIRRVELFGLGVIVRTYPPMRRYLQARNSIVLLRRHAANMPLWSLAQLCKLISVSIKIFALERASFGAWRKGLRDGRRRWTRQAPPGTNLPMPGSGLQLGQACKKQLTALSAFPDLPRS